MKFIKNRWTSSILQSMYNAVIITTILNFKKSKHINAIIVMSAKRRGLDYCGGHHITDHHIQLIWSQHLTDMWPHVTMCHMTRAQIHYYNTSLLYICCVYTTCDFYLLTVTYNVHCNYIAFVISPYGRHTCEHHLFTHQLIKLYFHFPVQSSSVVFLCLFVD